MESAQSPAMWGFQPAPETPQMPQFARSSVIVLICRFVQQALAINCIRKSIKTGAQKRRKAECAYDKKNASPRELLFHFSGALPGTTCRSSVLMRPAPLPRPRRRNA